jgi:RNA polymerase sigma factor (sigma-70 family)
MIKPADIQRKKSITDGQNDRQLWLRFKDGSESAFEEIYQTHVDPLYQYGMQIAANPDFVEETIQQLFVYLWNKRANLGEVHCIKGYLIKCLRREILRKLKKERQFLSEEQILTGDAFLTSDSCMDMMIRDQEEEERVHKLKRAMEHFSKREMEIIHLRFFQDLAYEHIAEMLGLNLKYVYNTASRAFQKLRDHYNQG